MNIGNIGFKFAAATLTATTAAIFNGVWGGLVGYVYGKLADIPAVEAAKAYAIWDAAQSALATFVSSFTDNFTHKVLISCTISTIGTAVGIYELRRRGLMGDKMMVFTVAMKAAAVALSLSCLKLGIVLREVITKAIEEKNKEANIEQEVAAPV